jgi:hypothetical protein
MLSAQSSAQYAVDKMGTRSNRFCQILKALVVQKGFHNL